MKIILIAPKTTTHHRDYQVPLRFDYALWNFYFPLLSLGHKVHFFDTCLNGDKQLQDKIKKFKPDLLFCVLTGDLAAFPHEPWETIKSETNKGNVVTFNWFCDDGWRFDDFSSKVCHTFHVCSTPQPDMISKYKDIGYENIIYGNWHSNSDLYSNLHCHRFYNFSFVGNLHSDRKHMIELLQRKGLAVHSFSQLPFEDMLAVYSRSQVSLSFTKNIKMGNQMQARLFEIPASATLLLTEYTPGIEELYEIDKEMVIFKDPEELYAKAKFLMENIKIGESIALAGHQRFLKEHDSRVRLKKVLREIKKK